MGLFSRFKKLFTRDKKVEDVVEDQNAELSTEELINQSVARLLDDKETKSAPLEFKDPTPSIPYSPPKKVSELEDDEPKPQDRVCFRINKQRKFVTDNADVIYHMPNFVTGLNENESTTEA